MDTQKIAEIAEETRQAYWRQHFPENLKLHRPTDPFFLIHYLRLAWTSEKGKVNRCWYNPKDKDGNPHIYVYATSEASLNANRDYLISYMWAHQIGHHVLQHGARDKQISEWSLNMLNHPDPIEQEANTFARYLLLPEPEIRAYLSRLEDKPKYLNEVARSFFVPRQMAETRFRELGFIA